MGEIPQRQEERQEEVRYFEKVQKKIRRQTSPHMVQQNLWEKSRSGRVFTFGESIMQRWLRNKLIDVHDVRRFLRRKQSINPILSRKINAIHIRSGFVFV